MHNLTCVLENDTQISLGFGIQTDPLIPAKIPGLIIINKKREVA